MEHKTQVQWASGLNVIAGIWLIISPWVLGFSGLNTPRDNAVILGIVVGILALIRAFGAFEAEWLSWINAILGIWLFISGWVLGYSTNLTPFWDTLILGVIVFVLAVWSASASRFTTPTRAARA